MVIAEKKINTMLKNKQTKNREVACDTTLLTKILILLKFHKISWQKSCPLSAFISYSRFYIVFSFIEQLQLHATNSGKFSFNFYSVTNIF